MLILDAAARRFSEFGFEATTVRQIADDVNILSGSLYHHFATKEEILDEIVREPVLSRRDRILHIAQQPLSVEQKVVTLIVDDLHALTTQQEAFAISFNERKFFRRSELFNYITKARKEAYDVWVNLLQDGISEGLFHPDIDTYLTISTIVRMLTAAADWYKHEDGSPLDAMGQYSLETLCEFYVGFILRSIRAPARAGAPIPEPVLDI